MPPSGGKRKRNDRTLSHDEGQGRPSPHRPESLNLAQQNQRYDGGGAGGGGRGERRRGRGGGHNTNNSNYGHSHPHNNQHASGPNATPTPSRTTPSAASSPAPTTPAPAAVPLRTLPAVSNTAASSPAPSPAPTRGDAQPLEPPPPAGRSAQATPAPQYAPRPQSPPRGAPTPYVYDYLTQDVVSKWQNGGKQSVIDAIEQAEDKEMVASSIIQELIRGTIDGRIAANDSGAVVKQILEQQSDNDRQELQSLIADTINVLEEADWKTSALRNFISAAAVSPDVLREELDVETLQALGLVRNTFSTMRNRKTTNLIYRQANFNLLREESEGYSKLITEYFNVSHVDNLSEPVAEDAFQRIKALVGSFDLDVGRVLDITLDLMSNLLVKNFRFFVKFLRASSWWPEDNIPEGIEWQGQGFSSLPTWALPNSGAWNVSSEERERLAALREIRDIAFWKRLGETDGMDAYFDLGARRITNLDDPAVAELLATELKPELNARGQDTNKVRRNRLNNARKWMRETGALPPPGNPDAAQILGFKLAFYASDARNKKDEMPDNLIWMAALLIKIGFISLRDLYPHLHPPDEQMPDVKVKLQKEKEEREKAARPGGSTTNALAMAGALADDTLTAPAVRALRDAERGGKSPKPDASAEKEAPKPAEELPEPPNQKIILLKSLLLIGALPEALFILGRFPWLADLVPDLPDYIHRILHQMLTKVYEPTRPLSDRPGLADSKEHIGDSAGLPKGSLKFVPPRKPKSLKWANLERGDIGDDIEYRYYWDDWTDNIPICQTVDDVFQMCNTILNYSGVKIGKDSALLMKLTRIGKKSLADDTSEKNKTRWIDLCKRLLVPALSLTRYNTGNVNEMFELLKEFPINVRYSIYAEWHFGATSRNPDIQSAFKLTQAETRDVLKRISKTNVRAMGKALSKVAFSSPGIVMQVAIHQMESYDNLIDVVVECVRYFSMLGYDVLAWCLMNALGGGGRNRVQADGMLTSAWLRALSTFAGSIFKRYSAIDPSPILQYITNELRLGNSTDLEILEQIITGMAGIRSDVTFNESQVLAMAGGKVLQAQTLISVADERHKMDKTSRRLVKALTEHGLAGQLLISIAQERQMYPNHDDAKFAPLKVLGNNVDKIHEVFHQYLETLRSNLATKDFDSVIPDTVSLMTDFGLDPAIAFLIGRASIAAAIASADASKESEQQLGKAKAGETSEKSKLTGDVAMTDADESSTLPVTADSSDTKDQTPAPADSTQPASEGDAKNGVPTPTPTPGPEPAEETQTSYWHPALTPMIEKLQQVKGDAFESSMNIPFYVTFWSLSLEDILVNSASYEQELTAQNYLINQINNDRSDSNIKATKEKEAKKKAIVELKERLTQEMRDQIKTYQRVRGRLIQEKAHWFSTLKAKTDIPHSLLQNCFLPRLLLSPIDAHYTFTMIKFLHNNCTPSFRTMHLYDHLFRKNQLTALMYQCTPREAENLGRFLNELLKDLLSWHAKQDQYEKNAIGVKRNLPGFAIGSKFNPDGSPIKFLEYEDFRRLLFKWHAALNGAFQACFQSGEYMHIRNAIVVLKAITQYFPKVNFMGDKLVASVTKISKEDERGDLKLAAMSLIGNLKKLQKSWLIIQDFRINKADPAPPAGEPRTGTPVNGNGTPLNPSASEFKPVGTDTTSAPVDEATRSEDGEIDEDRKDVVMSDKPSASQEASSSKEGEATQTEPMAKPSAYLPKRLDSSRAHTPVSGKTSTPTPSSRPSSTHPPSRTPHALPSKPDTRPAASWTVADRPSDKSRPPRHEGRDRGAHSQDHGRLEPPSDQVRTPSSRSRDGSPGRRSRARSPERDHSTDRRGPPRSIDDRAPARIPQDNRVSDRGAAYGPPPRRDGGHTVHPSREADIRGYSNGEPMPPPSSSDRGYGRSERGGQQSRLGDLPGPSFTSNSQPSTPAVNPARLALIANDVGDSREDRRSRDESRRDRDERRDRGMRPQSPRRSESQSTRSEQRVEPRRAPLDPNPFQSQTEQRDVRGDARDDARRAEPGDHAPTGPRGGRSGRNELPPKRGDLFESAGPARRPADLNHGRLNQDPPQDANYGRLNPAAEPPSGPRNFSGPSHFTPSGPSADVRSIQSPASQTPQSSSGRRPLQQMPSGRSQYDRSGAPSSAPSGPAAAPQNNQASPAIHPSRVSRLPADAIQTGPPSGPRSGAPTGPASSTPSTNTPSNRMAAPMGPSAGSSAGDRRILSGINSTLTGGGNGGPGASIKGRASRHNSMMPSSPSVPGAPTGPGNTPQNSRGQAPMQQSQVPPMHPSRMDNFAGVSTGSPADRSSGRRDDDRHRSARDDDRSRHGPSDSRDEYRDSERESRSGRGGPRGDRDRERDSRSDMDRRGGGRDRGPREPPAIASTLQPSSFNGPSLSGDQGGYASGPPSGGRGYDGRGGGGGGGGPPLPPSGRGGDDYGRRDGGRGSGGGGGGSGGGRGGDGSLRDDGRSGGNSGGSGRGSDRKRRGDDMHGGDRDRNDKRRRGGGGGGGGGGGVGM